MAPSLGTPKSRSECPLGSEPNYFLASTRAGQIQAPWLMGAKQLANEVWLSDRQWATLGKRPVNSPAKVELTRLAAFRTHCRVDPGELGRRSFSMAAVHRPVWPDDQRSAPAPGAGSLRDRDHSSWRFRSASRSQPPVPTRIRTGEQPVLPSQTHRPHGAFSRVVVDAGAAIAQDQCQCPPA